jgi:hypothetical protein
MSQEFIYMAKKNKKQPKKRIKNKKITARPSVNEAFNDTKTDQQSNNCIDSMNDIFQKSDVDLKKLAVQVNQHEADLLEKPVSQAFQHGLTDPLDAVDYFQRLRDNNDFFSDCMQEIAENWQNEYNKIHDLIKNHNDRRDALERIIRLLKPLAEQKTVSPNVLFSLAQAYYHRGLLFRPKEFHVPFRKIEACNLALGYCDQALKRVSDKNDRLYYPIIKIWLLAYYELERIHKHGGREQQYQNLIQIFVKPKTVRYLNDIAIYTAYLKQCKKTEIPPFKKLIQNILHTPHSLRPFEINLLKAKLCLYQNQYDKISHYALQSIQKAPRAFADPYWDALIAFLKEIKDMLPEWKKITISAWKKCCEQSERIGNNVHLCWYWSNQRALYDMAFSAETDPEKKARIADSIKSRPTLVLHAMNDLKKMAHEKGDSQTKQHIQKMIDQFSNARDNNYLKVINDLREIPKQQLPSYITESDSETPESESFSQDVPKGWTVIHFFLNEMDKTGHAMIYTEKSSWDYFQFNYSKLYHKFLEWQEDYLNHSNHDDALIELCREIGRSMDAFLFDEKSPITQKVIWIPHGFLHRLPLHAAIRSDENNKPLTYFFTHHQSRYLPAWHLRNFQKNDATQTQTLHCFEYLFNNIRECKNNQWIPNAGVDHLKDAMGEKIRNLILLCHGHCDSSNTFRTHLKLCDSNLTIYDIVRDQHDFDGTRLFIGACESEMVPPVKLSVDEHFSIAATFLLKKVSTVVASLWEVNSKIIDECFSEIIEQDSNQKQTTIEDALQDWQTDRCKNELQMVQVAPIRLIGMPDGTEYRGRSICKNVLSKIMRFGKTRNRRHK